MLRKAFILAFGALCAVAAAENAWTPEEETPQYWYDLGKQEVDIALQLEKNNNVAKNVIILLGDGMSIPTITAGRILKGQMQGKSGEETVLAMDQFPRVGLSKTYSVDKQVADSASTATAYLCGVKSTYYTMGLSGAVRKENCSSAKGNEVDSVLIDAFKADKSTGIVTTTRINHATPGGAYAHTASRFWYGDADLTQEAKDNGCKDIAQQFYDASDKITVTMGGGRQYFQPDYTYDPEYPSKKNARLDGQDLIEKWKKNQENKGLSASYVWNKDAFENVDPVTTDRLLGLFEPKDMNFEADRSDDVAGEPSLAEMTEKAIRILQKNTNGYFLLVEGGRIDHGHHATNAYQALHDFVAFDDAVAKAVEMTSDSDTLIIVTADHAHTFTLGGYSDRGNPIFGLAVTQGEINLGLDKKPYTSILYGNGPGYQGPGINLTEPHSRHNLTGYDTETKDYLEQSAVPLSSESHGGDDVAIMARGPMSHLFHGVHQQSYIAYVMRYASCIGDDTRNCLGNPTIPSPATTTTSTPQSSTVANFLGMGLNFTDAAVALNVQFALLIVLFVFSLAMCFIVWRQSKSNIKLSALRMNGYENHAKDITNL